MMDNIKKEWDIIIIGSGLGGLTAAAFLACSGKRVLVLEQHSQPGGNCLTFTRQKKYLFDIGVHFFGEACREGLIPAMYRTLGLKDAPDFINLGSESFAKCIFPDFTFQVPSGWDEYTRRLCSLFPDEEKNIKDFLSYLKTTENTWSKLLKDPFNFSKEKAFDFLNIIRNLEDDGTASLESIYTKYNLSPNARAALSSLNLIFSIAPEMNTAAVQSGFTSRFMKGVYYPRGGGRQLSDSLLSVIEAHQGKVAVNSKAAGIIVEDKQVRGVRLREGAEFYAPCVISNGDVKSTYLDLIEPENFSSRFLKNTGNFQMTSPFFNLFLGLDCDLSAFMDTPVYIHYETNDINGIYRDCRKGILPEKTGMILFGSAQALANRPGHNTLHIMTPVPSDYSFWGFEKPPVFQNRLYSKHEPYKKQKEVISNRILEVLEKILPGIGKHIVYSESASPLTQEYYTGASEGTAFGVQLNNKQQLYSNKIAGLYLAGANTLYGSGIVGVINSGIGVASIISGEDFRAKIDSNETVHTKTVNVNSKSGSSHEN